MRTVKYATYIKVKKERDSLKEMKLELNIINGLFEKGLIIDASNFPVKKLQTTVMNCIFNNGKGLKIKHKKHKKHK